MPNAEDPDMGKKQSEQNEDIRFLGEMVSPEMANDSNASPSKEVTLQKKICFHFILIQLFSICISTYSSVLLNRPCSCSSQDTFTNLHDLERIASFPIKPLQALKYDSFNDNFKLLF